MKKALIALLLIIALVSAGAVYFLSGKEYVYRFTEDQLKAKLDERLPLTRKYLYIIQVTLDNPRVSLTDGSDRVYAGLDIVLNITVGKESRPLGGTVDVSGGIKYVSAEGKFYLTDPVIENLDVQGVPMKYALSVRTAMTSAAAEYYSTHPIYSLKVTDEKQALAKMVLKDVVVKDHALIVTLGI